MVAVRRKIDSDDDEDDYDSEKNNQFTNHQNDCQFIEQEDVPYPSSANQSPPPLGKPFDRRRCCAISTARHDDDDDAAATMTNPLRRPSLLQARDLHSHAHSLRKLRHAHAHDEHHHEHRHPHESVLSPNRRRDGLYDSVPNNSNANDKSLPNPPPPAPAGAPAAAAPAVDVAVNAVAHAPPALITQVIQTVSLVQIVDTLGSPIETQTRYGPPNTILIDSSTGKTVEISVPDTSTILPAPGSSPEPSTKVSSSGIDTAPVPTTTISTSLSLAYTSPSAPLSTFPTLSGHHNGTNSHNGTTSQYFAKNATSTAFSALSFISTTKSASLSISLSESSYSTISSYSPIATDGVANGGVGGGAAGESSQPTSPANPNSGDSNLTPQQKQVIGGVVGGLGGAAFFGLLILLVLRYKRRRDSRALLGTIQSGSASRGLPPAGGPTGGDGNGSGGAMAERYSAAAITAAFAGLAGKRNSSTPNSTDGGERGFYRVSGRKLPSVLQVGGDGYSDPRESVMSGSSDYYRGSQSFEPAAGGETRLALGSPMRPVSGIPIIRSGPARTAVTERNPFADPPPPSTPTGDAPVPSLAQRDSPRSGRSGSRFQESI